MTSKEKAVELVKKHKELVLIGAYGDSLESAKQHAIISVENEYLYVRELLINLRSCKVIESEKVYLHRLDELVKEEQEVKKEIEKL